MFFGFSNKWAEFGDGWFVVELRGAVLEHGTVGGCDLRVLKVETVNVYVSGFSCRNLFEQSRQVASRQPPYFLSSRQQKVSKKWLLALRWALLWPDFGGVKKCSCRGIWALALGI